MILKALAAYAAIVFAGGTMQSVMTVPYEDPIKDGHEFTRDILAGVVHKSALKDATAGVPMFGRYDGQFNFREEVYPSFAKMTGSEFIAMSENKRREIAWLPALHFSAEAGELTQTSFEQPIQTFEPEGAINNPDVISLVPLASAHSDNKSYVLFKSERWISGNKRTFVSYIDENAGTIHDITYLPDTQQFNITKVATYGGNTLVWGTAFGPSTGEQKGLFRFENGTMILVRQNETINALWGKWLWLSNSVLNMETTEEMSLEDANRIYEFRQAKATFAASTLGVGRFGAWGAYRAKDLSTFKRLDVKAAPSAIAMEMASSGLDRNKLQRLFPTIGVYHDNDIQKYNAGSGYTFAVSKNYQSFEDTGVPVKSSYVAYARSHNYLYVASYKTTPDKGIIYTTERFRLRDNMVYGDRPYTERGRAWQH